VPVTFDRSSPCSAAIRETTGRVAPPAAAGDVDPRAAVHVRGGVGVALGGGRRAERGGRLGLAVDLLVRRRDRRRQLGGVRLARLRVGRDPREHRPDLDRRPDPDEDLGQAAGGRRRDVRVDLVRRDRGDGLLVLDPVADLLVPLDDRALGDRDPHLGHRHVDGGTAEGRTRM
jgi:hypothetical protein